MTAPLILPDPECSFGYPLGQVQGLLGDEERYGAFLTWMRGQTVAVCEGRAWNYDLRRFEPDACAYSPHGPIVYAADLHRWMQEAAA